MVGSCLNGDGRSSAEAHPAQPGRRADCPRERRCRRAQPSTKRWTRERGRRDRRNRAQTCQRLQPDRKQVRGRASWACGRLPNRRPRTARTAPRTRPRSPGLRREWRGRDSLPTAARTCFEYIADGGPWLSGRENRRGPAPAAAIWRHVRLQLNESRQNDWPCRWQPSRPGSGLPPFRRRGSSYSGAPAGF